MDGLLSIIIEAIRKHLAKLEEERPRHYTVEEYRAPVLGTQLKSHRRKHNYD